MSDKIQIFDNLTGETILREMTQEEQVKWDAQVAANKAAKEAKEQAEADLAAEKAALLNRLGITEKEAKLLLS